MPQIAQIGEIYASQLFWLAIFFGLILVVIGYGMLPKIQATVDARDEKIAADLKEAEDARAHADSLEEDYRAALDEARAQANKLAAEAKASAAKKTEGSLKRAETTINKKLDAAAAELAEARAAAMKDVEAVAAEAAQDMVAKIAGLKVDKKTAGASIKEELANG